jgi:hypothetical protein
MPRFFLPEEGKRVFELAGTGDDLIGEGTAMAFDTDAGDGARAGSGSEFEGRVDGLELDREELAADIFEGEGGVGAIEVPLVAVLIGEEITGAVPFFI